MSPPDSNRPLVGAIPILQVGQTLLVSLQMELRDAIAEAFQEDLLTAVERTGAKGVVVDISGLDLVDSYVARVLATTAQMAQLMGVDTVLCGMRPEVAATLVRMGYNMSGVRTALNVGEALEALTQRHARRRGDPGARQR